MRLRCLDLTRYGKFTGHTIHFGPREPGMPDFHIVYGPNEAGKTTALCAFLDLLYGIERSSPYNFLHAYPTMRVGATLEFGGQTHRLCRIKRPQNSLLDDEDRPLAEHLIQGHLGGIDRAAYRAMFSLDDETLEAGGEGILASKGDLGEALFSATAGLADLSQTLIRLRGEADEFHKPYARTSRLATLKAEVTRLKEERDRVDTAAAAYARLAEARDHARAAYDGAAKERGALQARLQEIGRRDGALRRVEPLRRLRVEMEPLADLPTPPASWAGEMPALREKEIGLAVAREKLAEDMARDKAALAAITVDPAAIALAPRIAAWNHLRARAVTTDIPARQQEAREEQLKIAAILGRLGRANEAEPASLLLDAATTGELRALIRAHSGIEQAAQAARREARDAAAALAEAIEDGGADIGDDAAAIAGLQAELAATQAQGLPARLSLALREEEQCRDRLAAAMQALAPWREGEGRGEGAGEDVGQEDGRRREPEQGKATALKAMLLPAPSDLHAWRAELTTCQATLRQHEAAASRHGQEQHRLRAELDARAGATGIGTEDEAGALRTARDQAWSDHRVRFDVASADVFEQAMRRDDQVTASRLQHAAAHAQAQQTTLAMAAAGTQELLARESLTTERALLRQLQDRVDAVSSAIAPGLTPSMSIAQIEAWLGRRDAALAASDSLRQAAFDWRAAQADMAWARDALARRLAGVLGQPAVDGSCGLDADGAALSALMAAAQTAIDEAGACRSRRQRVQDQRRALKHRQGACTQAEEDEAAWRAKWLEQCGACWLGTRGPPTPEAVQEILPCLAELDAALERRCKLQERIADMQAHLSAFTTEVEAAAALLGLSRDAQPPVAFGDMVVQAVRQAEAGRDRAGEATARLHAQRQHMLSLDEQAATHDRIVGGMARFFGVISLSDVELKLRDASHCGDLETRAAEAEHEICDLLHVGSMAEAESMLAGSERDALEREQSETHARLTDIDQRLRDLYAALCKAEDALVAVGGDGQAARLEEQRQYVLLGIAEGARTFLKLRTGTMAAEHALRAYRREHRSSMMQSASEAFRLISRDAYSGLASQPKKDGEELVAIAADGSSKLASALSKGTRFQLYLALRVAGYREFGRARDTVPFVADDIMETFDDFRSEEALRLFAATAMQGQVIYLTHHRHLCDIARQVCPSVRVHDLAPQA